jgi:cytochrome P450
MTQPHHHWHDHGSKSTVSPSQNSTAGRGDPDPYPSYAFLRESAPISPVARNDGNGTAWLVTSYDLCRTCLTDPRLSSDSRNAAGGNLIDKGRTDPIERNLLGLDPPDHTRLRRVVSAAFSAGAVAGLRPRIEQICLTAIGSFRSRGTADLAREYALAVPVAVIHDVLGIPEEQRKEPTDCFDLFCRVVSLGPRDRPAGESAASYLDGLIDYKRAHRGDDLTTALLDDLDRGWLRSEGELRATLFVLLGAGHTTTFPFLGAAILRSLQLRGRPAVLTGEPETCRRWLDEVLRYDSPVQASQRRYALADVSIGGVRIATGDTVILSFAAANRDPGRFDHPDEPSQERDSRAHLAFGHGAHFCLGAHLARTEGEIALRSLFGAIPDIQLSVAPGEIAWAFGPMLRGPRELPVAFGPLPPPAA